jgi:hypothetical protein
MCLMPGPWDMPTHRRTYLPPHQHARYVPMHTTSANAWLCPPTHLPACPPDAPMCQRDDALSPKTPASQSVMHRREWCTGMSDCPTDIFLVQRRKDVPRTNRCSLRMCCKLVPARLQGPLVIYYNTITYRPKIKGSQAKRKRK